MHATGIMIGHFEPLHLGQMRSILHAAGQVQTLHVVITKHPRANPGFPVTLEDKARWLQMACADLPFVKVHITSDIQITAHDDFDAVEINIERSNAKLRHIVGTLGVASTPVLFVASNNPLANPRVVDQLTLPISKTPVQPQYDSLAIHQDPVAHWQAIHPTARGDYTQTVAIVGGESSGKTTLVHKLANHYGASFALEMGRLYVGTDLGGSEIALQYSDYAPIAIDHAEAIREATQNATAPVTFVDTDFVTTQAFCEIYEGHSHPFVAACIDEFRLHHTLMLANNTPWIADGMRSLGSEDARSRFESRLLDIFARHQIEPYRISDPNYEQRYRAALAYIDQHIYGKSS